MLGSSTSSSHTPNPPTTRRILACDQTTSVRPVSNFKYKVDSMVNAKICAYKQNYDAFSAPFGASLAPIPPIIVRLRLFIEPI